MSDQVPTHGDTLTEASGRHMSSLGHPEDLAGGKGGLELLQADLAELENSIQHLVRSNNELSKV